MHAQCCAYLYLVWISSSVEIPSNWNNINATIQKTPPHSFHHITHPFSFVRRIKFNLIQRQLHANIHIQILCSPPLFTRVSLIHERSMAFLPDLLKSSHFSIPRGKFLTGHSNTHNFIYKYTYSCPLVLDFHCFNVSSSILIRILTVPTTINS